MTPEPGMDSGLTDALVRSRRFFTRGTVSTDLLYWNTLYPTALPNGELSLRLPMDGQRAFMQWNPLRLEAGDD